MADRRSWFFSAASLLLGSVVFLGLAAAQAPEAKQAPLPLPDVLAKPQPETIQDLRDIEDHVKKLVAKVMPAVVGIRIGAGQGSGIIVSEDGLVLTAGHVSGKPGQNATIILPNGRQLKGKSLGQNTGIDSGMVKILDKDKFPFIDMGKASELKKGNWVVAIGHPGGVRSNRTPVVRLGRILYASPLVLQSDCTLVGGDSGGPLFNMQGQIVGIHSRIGGFQISDNMHVPVDTYRQTWERLIAGDSWGGRLGSMPFVTTPGGKIVLEKQEALTKDDPVGPCPEDSTLKSYRKTYSFAMKAGSTYTIDLISADTSGKKLDAYLILEDSQSKELATDDDGGGFPHARIVHRAAKDEERRIIATTFSAKQTGKFTLRVREAEFQDGKIEVLKSVKLPPPMMPKILQTFNRGLSRLHVSACLVDEKGAPLKSKEIALQWDQGKVVGKSDSEGYVRWPLQKDYKNITLVLPKGVRAALTLTDQNGIDFSTLLKQDITEEKVKSAGGTIVKNVFGTLRKSDPFDSERTDCFRHVHEFAMQAGKTYTIDLVSDEFNAYLRLENDEQGTIAEDDDGAGMLNSRIVFTPTSDGTYRIVATTNESRDTGGYRLIIREIDAKK
jgi:S1-C subfamily serine protease